MPATTPDNIYSADSTGPGDPATISALEASSVQAAFLNRGRYTYSWANAAARTAQLNMNTGATGYQVDTKTEYIYENGAWRLATPHAEFTASQSTTSANLTLAGVFTLDAAQSTSSTFAIPGTSGIITLVDPGIYAISSVTNTSSAVSVTGRTFLDMSKVLSAGDQQRVSIVTGEDRGSLSRPNIRTTVANQNIYIQHYFTIGATNVINTRLFITRLG